MMLIICDKTPQKAVDYLVEHTNKNFCFKQLIELSQLLSGCGITDKMKPIKAGKEIKYWIKRNPRWVFSYFQELWMWSRANINLKQETDVKLYGILKDLNDYAEAYKTNCGDKPITTAIWRYSKEYEREYESNSELPIDIAVEQYKKYLNWKFRKDEI